jgi:hypothetical protein
MQVTEKDLIESKIFVPNNEIFSFLPPMDYIQPFNDVVKSIGGTTMYEAEIGSKNLNADADLGANTAYSRVSVKIKMPSEFDIVTDDVFFKDLFGEIGLVYALDTQKPEMKVWRGNRVFVCTNQCVFGADNVTSIQLKDGREHIYERVSRYIDQAMVQRQYHIDKIEMLTEQSYSGGKLNEKIGEMFRYGLSNKKLGVNVISATLKSIESKTSRYSLDENGSITGWKLYNAVTEELKNSSILDEVSKTLLLEKLFLN